MADDVVGQVGPGGQVGQADGDQQQQRNGDAPPASWDEVFQHERFKGLLKRAKEAETALERINRERDEGEQAKLKEQQRFQELFEKEQQRAKALEAELQGARLAAANDRRMRALEAAARAHEPPFLAQALADVAVFVDLTTLEIDEAGTVKGAEAAIRDLAKAKPYLLEQRRQDPGSPGAQKPASGPAKSAGKGLTL